MITEPCVVLKVHDGDSFTLKIGEAKLLLRLDQIDAPELRQDYGKRARLAVYKLVDGRQFAVQRGLVDKYGRVIGTLWDEHGANFNLELVRAGLAWAYTRYVRDAAFTAAQEEAAAAKRGLWSLKRKPTAPWIWRQKHGIGEVQDEAQNGSA